MAQQPRVDLVIPCLNEALTLPDTVRDLPRHLPGIDAIEVLVIGGFKLAAKHSPHGNNRYV